MEGGLGGGGGGEHQQKFCVRGGEQHNLFQVFLRVKIEISRQNRIIIVVLQIFGRF